MLILNHFVHVSKLDHFRVRIHDCIFWIFSKDMRVDAFMYYVFCMFYVHELLYSSSIFYKVKSWLKMWEVDGEKARHFYRLLFDALTEDRQRCGVHVICLQNGTSLNLLLFLLNWDTSFSRLQYFLWLF